MTYETAKIAAFRDELEKIALTAPQAGALLGAALGGGIGAYKEVDRKDPLKTKAKRTALKALIGSGIGAAAAKGGSSILDGVFNRLSKTTENSMREGLKGSFWNLFQRRK